ncbi:MAG: alcohol dehydrogenase catalytic domain-containing protein [Clostridiales bacterium]|nr:alcohol dehydrogenase catalytic domain-containing protein [Clostridiales bacterium]
MERKTMKGVLKSLPQEGAEYREDLPIPEVGPRDILVKVQAAAICGTDQHIINWTEYAKQRLTLPMVFGHEFAGDVVAVGSDVHELSVGDRVAGETHIPCNHCYMCKTNRRHNCANMKIIGVHAPGAFAEYISFPADCAYKLDDDISYEIGAMLEPMGVAVHGVSAGEVKGCNVLIFGCGPIGLMAVGAARAMGAKKIFAADVFDAKLEIAKVMGADAVLNTRAMSADEARAKLLEYTDGMGADVVIDYTGNAAALQQGFGMLRKNGTFIMVGLPDKPIALDLTDAIVYKEATVKGVTGRLMYETWDECIDILKNSEFSMEPVTGGVYPLSNYMDAFNAIFSGVPGKMLLIPGK